MKLSRMLASLEESDGVARQVDVTKASASATKDHPAAPEAEANSDGKAAGAADTVTAGEGDGVTPTIQDAINKGVQVGEDVTKMVAAQEALDAAVASVEAYIDRNESVPPSVAETIAISLRRHDNSFFRKSVPALEGFSAPTGRMDATLELQTRLKRRQGLLKTAIANARSMLRGA